MCIALIALTDSHSAGVWDDYYHIDDRLVTGQNPASALSTARAAVAVYESQKGKH
jgi:putative intracellular protease/amidase